MEDDVGVPDFNNVSYESLNFNLSNLTIAEVENHSDIMQHPITKTIIMVEYLIIFILGVFGNCLVCYVVFRNKHMQTVTNYFIANLALADILLCVLAVPFTPLYFFMREWVFGGVLCTLVSVAQGTSVYVSTLTLTAIAIDRYFVIIYPFRPKLQLPVCYSIILGVWLFSVTATFPYAIYVAHAEYENVSYCEEMWPSELSRKVFSLFTTVMQFVVPFIIILFCYVRISLRMSERIRCKPGARGSRKEESDREKKSRTNRMLIAMVTIFGGCWMPLNSINLIGDYYAPAGHWKYYNLFFFVAHIVAMSSTCYNPFLYAWLNENFRKEFQQVLPCFKETGGPSGRQFRHRSERTCNGNNETVEEVLPNLGALESFVSKDDGEGTFSHGGRKLSQGRGTVELIQLTTVNEEVTTNGELKDSNGDSPSLFDGSEPTETARV